MARKADDYDKYAFQFTMLSDKVDKVFKNNEIEESKMVDEERELQTLIKLAARESEELNKRVLEMNLEYEQLSMDCDQMRKSADKSIKMSNEIKLKVDPILQTCNDFENRVKLTQNYCKEQNEGKNVIEQEMQDLIKLHEHVIAATPKGKLLALQNEVASLSNEIEELETFMKSDIETVEIEVTNTMSELSIFSEQMIAAEEKLLETAKVVDNLSVAIAEDENMIESIQLFSTRVLNHADEVQKSLNEQSLKRSQYENYRETSLGKIDEEAKRLSARIDAGKAEKFSLEKRDLQVRDWQAAIVKRKSEKAAKEADALRKLRNKSPRKSNPDLSQRSVQLDTNRRRVTFQDPLHSSNFENVRPVKDKSKTTSVKGKKRKSGEDYDDYLPGFMNFD